MKSYITDDEFFATDMLVKLKHGYPTHWLYRNVSQTQLSIARLTGMVKINGHTFIYFPTSDELIWDDALKMIHNQRRLAAKVARTEAKERAAKAQGDLL